MIKGKTVSNRRMKKGKVGGRKEEKKALGDTVEKEEYYRNVKCM